MRLRSDHGARHEHAGGSGVCWTVLKTFQDAAGTAGLAETAEVGQGVCGVLDRWCGLPELACCVPAAARELFARPSGILARDAGCWPKRFLGRGRSTVTSSVARLAPRCSEFLKRPRRSQAQARHAERDAVAEEDLREALADDARRARPALQRLRRVLARAAAAEVAADQRAPRAGKRGIVERVRLPLPRACARSSSKTCAPSPSKVTRVRKRAGMMRSVSMSLPGYGMAAARDDA